jgi:hypothetical protein
VDGDLWEAPAVHLPAEQEGHGDKESVVARGQGQEATGVGEHGARGQLTAHSAARAAQGAHCSQACTLRIAVPSGGGIRYVFHNLRMFTPTNCFYQSPVCVPDNKTSRLLSQHLYRGSILRHENHHHQKIFSPPMTCQ